MKLKCKAQDLNARLTEAWGELEAKKAAVKQAFADHRNYINSLSHSEYLEWKRRRDERLASEYLEWKRRIIEKEEALGN
mgnify:CR=1 FL=1